MVLGHLTLGGFGLPSAEPSEDSRTEFSEVASQFITEMLLRAAGYSMGGQGRQGKKRRK